MDDTPELTPKKRILLVEDERHMRIMIKSFLLLDDYEVVEANNGAEAMGLFRQTDFDLVMTDHKMPFINGSELAFKIRKLAPAKPILMISGEAHKSGPHNPVNAVLHKPFTLEILRSAVSRLLAATEKCAA